MENAMHYKNRCYNNSSTILALISKFEMKLNFNSTELNSRGTPRV